MPQSTLKIFLYRESSTYPGKKELNVRQALRGFILWRGKEWLSDIEIFG